MKPFQYIYYFFRSLLLRGIYKTFRMLRDEPVYEKRLKVRTSGIENLGGMTLAKPANRGQFHYQGASYTVLFNVLSHLPETVKQKPFIDYGCGKGRALFVAEQCGFTKLIGVDIAQELLDAARKNLERYTPKDPQSRFELVFSDATTYAIPPASSVFYFFNPFGPAVLGPVADAILESYRQQPREIYVVYVNPKYNHIFTAKGFQTYRILRSFMYKEAIVYTLSS